MLLWSGSVARWFPCYAVGLYGRHLASEGYQGKTSHVEVDQEALEADFGDAALLPAQKAILRMPVSSIVREIRKVCCSTAP